MIENMVLNMSPPNPTSTILNTFMFFEKRRVKLTRVFWIRKIDGALGLSRFLIVGKPGPADPTNAKPMLPSSLTRARFGHARVLELLISDLAQKGVFRKRSFRGSETSTSEQHLETRKDTPREIV